MLERGVCELAHSFFHLSSVDYSVFTLVIREGQLGLYTQAICNVITGEIILLSLTDSSSHMNTNR